MREATSTSLGICHRIELLMNIFIEMCSFVFFLLQIQSGKFALLFQIPLKITIDVSQFSLISSSYYTVVPCSMVYWWLGSCSRAQYHDAGSAFSSTFLVPSFELCIYFWTLNFVIQFQIILVHSQRIKSKTAEVLSPSMLIDICHIDYDITGLRSSYIKLLTVGLGTLPTFPHPPKKNTSVLTNEEVVAMLE